MLHHAAIVGCYCLQRTQRKETPLVDNGTIRLLCKFSKEPGIFQMDWEEFERLTDLLAQRIQADRCPDIIVGLQRGGLIPAVMLSHQLGTQLFLSLPVKSTSSDVVYASKRPPVIIANDLFAQIAGKDTVVVDDVVGSGDTLRGVLHTLHRYAPAQIRSVAYIVNREHWEPVNEREPMEAITYIGEEIRGWVIFPWERRLFHPEDTENVETPSLPTL